MKMGAYVRNVRQGGKTMANDEKKTSIFISKELKGRLEKCGSKSETWEEILSRVLDNNDEYWRMKAKLEKGKLPKE